MEIFNIGVYNSSETVFFNKLLKNGIDTFIDVRQRRGVRGSKYSFVNSKKLQDKLSQLNIKYFHFLELAPNDEIRNFQKLADKQKNELKKTRDKLDDSFILNYNNLILDNYNIELMITNLQKDGSSKIVFFCVEEKAESCHRHLITEKIKAELKLTTYNL